ncbi:MAG: hypothetical protein ACKKL4_02980 [Patescibacteria group bacterium]
MAMPSRRMILSLIFIGFVLFVLGVLVWYFSPAFFGPSTQDGDSGRGGGINLFPFGDSGGEGDQGAGGQVVDQGDTDTQDKEQDLGRMPRLRMVSKGPVIAATMSQASSHSGIVGPSATSTNDAGIENSIRYVELGTGHIYEASTFNRDITRLSNTTIPRINEAQFVTLDRILMRYTDDLGNYKLFSAELADNASPSASTPKRLQGIFLPDGVRYIDVSPEGKLVWLQNMSNGVRVVTTNALGENQKQIYSSPLSEWRIGWYGSNNEVLLQSTPSYESYGMAYTLDASNGSLRPYGEARKALGVLPTPDRKRALVSLKADGQTRLFLWRQESNEYVDLTPRTFVEKCVYASVRDEFYCASPISPIARAEPDLWYQGVSSYRDDIWVIDGQTGASELALSPSGLSDDPIDIIDLAISPDEQFLYFRDKDTRSLWTFQIDYIRGSTESSNSSEVESASEPDSGLDADTDEEPFFE